MRKYLNLTINGLIAALTFIFFALPTLASEFGSMSGYEHINFSSGFDFVTFFGFFGLILLFINLFVLIFVILELLNKLSVLKIDINFSRTLSILNFMGIICSLLCLLTNIISAINLNASISVCSIFILVIYIAGFVSQLFIKDQD